MVPEAGVSCAQALWRELCFVSAKEHWFPSTGKLLWLPVSPSVVTLCELQRKFWNLHLQDTLVFGVSSFL